MKKLYLSILLIVILSCKTTSESINPPVDYSDVIDEAVKVEPELKKSNLKPESKKAITSTINSLKECQEYSSKSYSKILEIEQRLNDLETENTRLKNRNEALEKELEFYRFIKWGLISFLVIFTLHKLGVFKLLFKIDKKAIFPVG
mgnify:FL=1